MKFSVAHPNPGKRSTENFTKISRHLWQRKTEKIFTSALLQGSCPDKLLRLRLCNLGNEILVAIRLLNLMAGPRSIVNSASLWERQTHPQCIVGMRGVYKLGCGEHVNRPLCWDDEVGPLVTSCFLSATST